MSQERHSPLAIHSTGVDDPHELVQRQQVIRRSKVAAAVVVAGACGWKRLLALASTSTVSMRLSILVHLKLLLPVRSAASWSAME